MRRIIAIKGLCAAVALAATPVLAQSDAGRAAGPASGAIVGISPAPVPIHYLSSRPAGAWTAADLIGREVFSARDENIGEVDDVLIGRDGKVAALVLDVGGFLGVGETRVAVPMEAVNLTGLSGTEPSGSTASPDAKAARVVVDVSRTQLEAAPAFEQKEGQRRAE